MSSQSLVIGLVVLVWLLYRQTQPRRVKHDREALLPLILAVVGIIDVVDYANKHPLSGGTVAVLVVSLAVGIALAAVRARSFHVWWTDDGPMRQGTVLTVALWIVAVVVHLGGDQVLTTSTSGSDIGSISLLLYLGLVLLVQRVLVGERARRMQPGPI